MPAWAGNSPVSAPAMASAMAANERNHWQAAFDELAALADGGDADAAPMALRMARHGPALYGTTFGLPPARAAQWLATAALKPASVVACASPPMLAGPQEQP